MKTIVNTDYKYSDLTGKIIGCAIEVHNIIGPGFQEKIYQRALAIEMSLQGLSFVEQFSHTVFYKGEIAGGRRSDYIVEGVISVEIKALSQTDDADLNQAINYLEAYRLEIGLLINFGSRRLQVKRVINSKARNNQ